MLTYDDVPRAFNLASYFVDRNVEDFGVVKLHSFYVRYLLPLMIEVQCFEWAPGISAASLPQATR